MWIYRSPIGKLIIEKLPDGQYGLFYNDQLYMASEDINAIANNVYLQASGCTDWDLYPIDDDDTTIPEHIEQWEKV